LAKEFCSLAAERITDQTLRCLGLIRRTLNYRSETKLPWLHWFVESLLEDPTQLQNLVGNPSASSTLVDVLLEHLGSIILAVPRFKDNKADILQNLAKPVGVWMLYSSTRALLRSVNPRSLRARVDVVHYKAPWLFVKANRVFVDTLVRDAHEVVDALVVQDTPDGKPLNYHRLYVRELVSTLREYCKDYDLCPSDSQYMKRTVRCKAPADLPAPRPLAGLGTRPDGYWTQLMGAVM
jgi:hypothetical protein